MDFDMGRVITIDGPAASGKTSVSRELAKRLGWNWVSTGSFYRGLGYAALRKKIHLDDEKALCDLATSPDWSVRMTDDQTQVFFGDEDVTRQLIMEDVGNIASRISHFPEVRKALLDPQRKCCEITEGLVAEGRDCGTVVFPQAEVKIYITANQEDRAARRARELGSDAIQIEEAQKQRDLQDSSRKVAPMQVPENAFVVDTTHMSLSEVVDAIETYVRKKIGEKA